MVLIIKMDSPYYLPDLNLLVPSFCRKFERPILNIPPGRSDRNNVNTRSLTHRPPKRRVGRRYIHFSFFGDGKFSWFPPTYFPEFALQKSQEPWFLWYFETKNTIHHPNRWSKLSLEGIYSALKWMNIYNTWELVLPSIKNVKRF